MTLAADAEFFAGIGCACVGLGPDWRCQFANDIDPKKASVYRANLGADHLRVCDICDIHAVDLPEVDLGWASPPCQDLSEAGGRSGLNGERSAAFWPYAGLLGPLARQGRAPKLAVIENVLGLITGHNGRDLIAVIEALADIGYVVGALVIDAVLFVPQSRERVFVIGVRGDLAIPASLNGMRPTPWCSTKSLVKALDGHVSWWTVLPLPAASPATLETCFDAKATGWIRMQLSDFGEPSRSLRREVETRLSAGGRHLGTAYRRRRPVKGSKTGEKISVWEPRFDGVAGALRVASSGGSSPQSWTLIENGRISRRKFTPREAARVMGLPDGFRLPPGNDGLSCVGDGVCPQVVRFLAEHLLEPILQAGDVPSGASRDAHRAASPEQLSLDV
jgi:DNA (cytosine-5)-methyltransferase 1